MTKGYRKSKIGEVTKRPMDYKKLKNLLLEYLTETTKLVREKAAKGQGRNIVGEVINRPEDIEIGIAFEYPTWDRLQTMFNPL